MTFELTSAPSSIYEFDLWDIAARHNLKPRRQGYRIRFYCPMCDSDANRKKSPTGSANARVDGNPWKCWRCDAKGNARTLAGHFGEWRSVYDEPEAISIPIEPRPKPRPEQIKQVNVEAAWSEIRGAQTAWGLERIGDWCKVRGWPDDVGQAVVLSDEVAHAHVEDLRELRNAKPIIRKARSRGLGLLIPIRDADGIARTMATRWDEHGDRPLRRSGRPWAKSASLPATMVGPGDSWGGVWVYGSIPVAVQAIEAGEPLYLVEGAPDFLALTGRLMSLGLPGAVLGLYQAQTADKVAGAILDEMGRAGIVADRIVLVPHADNPTEGEEHGIGMRSMLDAGQILSGRAGVFVADLPVGVNDWSDLLRDFPADALKPLNVARCIHPRPIPLDEAPAEMSRRFRQIVLEACTRSASGKRSVVVFRVPMGVGKTFNALKTAGEIVTGGFKIPVNGRRPKKVAEADWPPADRSVVMCLPDHGLAEEKVGELAEICPEAKSRHVYGMLKYCAFQTNVEPIFPAVGRRGICGPAKRYGDERDEQRCPHRDTCPGAREPSAERGEVTFTPHALLGSVKADLVIVDESPGVIQMEVIDQRQGDDIHPIVSLFACRMIPRVLRWRQRTNPAAGNAAQMFVKIVQNLAYEHAYQASTGEVDGYDRRLWGEELVALLDGDEDLLGEMMAGFGPDAPPPPAPFPQEARQGFFALNKMPSRPAFRAMQALTEYYARQKGLVPDFDAADDPLGLADKAPPKPMCAIRLGTDGSWSLEVRRIGRLPDAPVIVLDATGHLTIDEWRAAYPDRTVIMRSLEVQGAAPERAIHVDSPSFSRRRIVGGDGQITEKAAGLVCGALDRLATEARLAKVRLEGQAPLALGVLTHMPICKAIGAAEKENAPPGALALVRGLESIERRGCTFDSDDGPRFGWFGRHDRGTNAFEGVDGFAVIGDPWGDIGALSLDAAMLDLDPDSITRARAAATCQQAIARARHIRRDGNDRVVLLFAGRTPPDLPGVVWRKERLGNDRTETANMVTELVWHIAREEGVIGVPVVRRFDPAGTPWGDMDMGQINIGHIRRAYKRVQKAIGWREHRIQREDTGHPFTLAAPTLLQAEAWAEREGFISRLDRVEAPF